MRTIKVVSIVAVLACLSAAPSLAGDVSVFGSHWDTDEADDTFGGGVAFATGTESRLGLELRASYYEELSNEPLENIFDSDPVFEDGLEVLPLEAGLRFRLTEPERKFRPYLSGGGGYFLMDSDFGDVDDEFGWYAAVGSEIGNRTGAEFFAEVNYRRIEGSVEVDPNSISDIDDIEFQDQVDVDLSGLGVNLGMSWVW